jgi:hypothetical protein
VDPDAVEPDWLEDARWLDDIFADDPLGAVVRGHLYVESLLITLIEEALLNPEAIDLARLNFPLKMDLAVALGLVNPDDAPAFLFLNRLRNRFAHNVEATVSSEDEKAFLAAMSPRLQHMLPGREQPQGEVEGELWNRLLLVLYVSLYHQLSEIKKAKAQTEKLLAEVQPIVARYEARRLQRHNQASKQVP